MVVKQSIIQDVQGNQDRTEKLQNRAYYTRLTHVYVESELTTRRVRVAFGVGAQITCTGPD